MFLRRLQGLDRQLANENAHMIFLLLLELVLLVLFYQSLRQFKLNNIQIIAIKQQQQQHDYIVT